VGEGKRIEGKEGDSHSNLSNQLLERPQRQRTGPHFSFAQIRGRSLEKDRGGKNKEEREEKKNDLLNHSRWLSASALALENILYLLPVAPAGHADAEGLPQDRKEERKEQEIPRPSSCRLVSALIMLAGIYYGEPVTGGVEKKGRE